KFAHVSETRLGSRPGNRLETPARLFQVNRFFQRQVLRRAAYQKCIVAGNELPGIALNVKDGEVFRIDLYRYLFTFSRIQFDFAPAHQPFWRFAGTFRERGVTLANFCSRSTAGIGYLETQAYSLSR